MSINDNQLIDKYFQGMLTPEERMLFEEKLSRDPAWRKEVETHQQALQLIDKEGHRMLKERLAAKGRAIDHSRRLRKWLGLLMIGLACILLFKLTGVLQSAKQDTTEENLLPPVMPETNPAIPSKTDTIQDGNKDRVENQQENPGSTTVPKKTTKQNTDELFAAYYTPFEDEGLQPGHRGQNSSSVSDRFVEAYLKGSYSKALALFDDMDIYDRQNDNMLFIKALTLIETGGDRQAIRLLEQIVERDQSRYMAAAQWYLALTYLKSGAHEKAKGLLRQSKENPSDPYSKKALMLLQKI